MSLTPNTPISSPPGHQDLDASLAAPAQVDQVGGTTPDLQKLRLFYFVIFLAFAFGAPIGLSAFLVAISSLFAFVEAHFSAYAPAIYAWLIWFGFCLVISIYSYWEDKRELGA